LEREETSINRTSILLSHASSGTKRGVDATFCKDGGVSEGKKGAAAGAPAFLACSQSPFATSHLLLLLRHFLGEDNL
jgi:hypothetical protein